MTRRPCASCERNRAERFFVSERGRICVDCQRAKRRQSARRRHVEQTYGLTEADHDTLLDHQDGACAICRGQRTYALNVDHNHSTGAVRGLLCRRCNKLLRDVRDNPAVLRAAAVYLEWPPAKVIGIEARL